MQAIQHPPWMWTTFAVVLAVLLVIDLVAHRGEHGQSRKAAIAWSLIWVGIGLAFGGFVWVAIGGTAASEYYSAYLIEKSLSVDNLFVFLLIFQSLRIPHDQQRRVLIWGILGALIFRAVFIFLGVRALETIDWMAYVFGAILAWAAWRIFREDPREKEESRTVSWLSRHLPITESIQGHQFIAKVEGKTVATPLLVALLALASTDIMFAIDSIPAALSVTRDAFVVYSSNAFAILGLRALYIVLADLVANLKYLHYGLAAVLVFAAFKIVTNDFIHVPAWLSITVIAAALAVAVIASLMHRRRHGREEEEEEPPHGTHEPA